MHYFPHFLYYQHPPLPAPKISHHSFYISHPSQKYNFSPKISFLIPPGNTLISLSFFLCLSTLYSHSSCKSIQTVNEGDKEIFRFLLQLSLTPSGKTSLGTSGIPRLNNISQTSSPYFSPVSLTLSGDQRFSHLFPCNYIIRAAAIIWYFLWVAYSSSDNIPLKNEDYYHPIKQSVNFCSNAFIQNCVELFTIFPHVLEKAPNLYLSLNTAGHCAGSWFCSIKYLARGSWYFWPGVGMNTPHLQVLFRLGKRGYVTIEIILQKLLTCCQMFYHWLSQQSWEIWGHQSSSSSSVFSHLL